MYILEAQHISKKYATHQALKDVSLSIPQGKIFGLLGPNGAGKTTFIRIINQIIGPDEGTILFDGEPLRPEHISMIGYLPEERGLYRKMKVGEQAIYLARLKGLSKKEAKQRLEEWFDKFQLSGWWNKRVEELSKGMQQKIQFIVTVLHRPKLLIFDEPFSGFDPVNADIIKKEILQLKQNGATIIFSTHRMESVEELCDHIALIHRSQKILDGSLHEIKMQFRTHSYYFHVVCSNIAAMKNMLPAGIEITEESQPFDGEIAIRCKIPGTLKSNDLLKLLGERYEIREFREILPTANDIFIQHVKQPQ